MYVTYKVTLPLSLFSELALWEGLRATKSAINAVIKSSCWCLQRVLLGGRYVLVSIRSLGRSYRDWSTHYNFFCDDITGESQGACGTEAVCRSRAGLPGYIEPGGSYG